MVLVVLVLARGLYMGWAGSFGWASNAYLGTLAAGLVGEIVRRRLVRRRARRAIVRNEPSAVEVSARR